MFSDTYQEGIDKMLSLQRKSNAFTVEEGETSKEKEIREMEKIRRHKLMSQSKNIKSAISTKSSDPQTASSSTIDNVESKETSVSGNLKSKKFKKHQHNKSRKKFTTPMFFFFRLYFEHQQTHPTICEQFFILYINRK